MSSPTATTSAAAVAAVAVSSHHPMVPTMVGYTTTGRPSTHQQQPMSFTRALEMTENLDQRGRPQSQQPSVGVPVNQGPPQPSSQPLDPQSASNEDNRRDSVYDMNSYEISVWRHAKKLKNSKKSWMNKWKFMKSKIGKNLIEQIGFSDVIASLPFIDKCYVSLSSWIFVNVRRRRLTRF